MAFGDLLQLLLFLLAEDDLCGSFRHGHFSLAFSSYPITLTLLIGSP
jgi:hypothetical protein